MRGYILHFVLGFLALMLGVVLYFLFSKANVPLANDLVAKYNTNFKLPVQIYDTWRDKMAKLTMRDYSPAVSEFYLKFNVHKFVEEKKRQVFKLQVSSNSFYSRFCLVQTLNSYKIQYKLAQGPRGTQIYLDTDNKKLLSNIIEKLAEYNIQAKASELWL